SATPALPAPSPAPPMAAAEPAARLQAHVTANEQSDELTLRWEGDEKIQVTVSKSRGLFNGPMRISVGNQEISLGGFYVHVSGRTNGFAVESTQAGLNEHRIDATQVLRHPQLSSPTRLQFRLWMEPQDCGLRVQVSVEGKDQHLDRLGLGEHSGTGLAAERMF